MRARRAEKQRVPVRGRTLHFHRADHAVGAGPVLDQHGLTQAVLQLGPQLARQQVGAAARRKGDDDGDGSGWGVTPLFLDVDEDAQAHQAVDQQHQIGADALIGDRAAAQIGLRQAQHQRGKAEHAQPGQPGVDQPRRALCPSQVQTRQRLLALGLRWRELPPLWDVDRPADLPRLATLRGFTGDRGATRERV